MTSGNRSIGQGESYYDDDDPIFLAALGMAEQKLASRTGKSKGGNGAVEGMSVDYSHLKLKDEYW